MELNSKDDLYSALDEIMARLSVITINQWKNKRRQP